MNQPLNTREISANFGIRVNAKHPTVASGTYFTGTIHYVTENSIYLMRLIFYENSVFSFLGKLKDMF